MTDASGPAAPPEVPSANAGVNQGPTLAYVKQQYQILKEYIDSRDSGGDGTTTNRAATTSMNKVSVVCSCT